MNPEYIAAKLSLLPRFNVESLSRECGEDGDLIVLTGRFSEPVGFEDQSTYLYLSDLRSIYGLLLAAPGKQELRLFKQHWYTNITDSELLKSELYYLAAIDDRRVHLVLDPEINWIEVNFKPQRALQSQVVGTDGKLYTQIKPLLDGDPVSTGSTIVESGWDHEHCIFCMKRIDEENSGYTSVSLEWGDEWVCRWCYRNAVEPHDPRPLLLNYAERGEAN